MQTACTSCYQIFTLETGVKVFVPQQSLALARSFSASLKLPRLLPPEVLSVHKRNYLLKLIGEYLLADCNKRLRQAKISHLNLNSLGGAY